MTNGRYHHGVDIIVYTNHCLPLRRKVKHTDTVRDQILKNNNNKAYSCVYRSVLCIMLYLYISDQI